MIADDIQKVGFADHPKDVVKLAKGYLALEVRCAALEAEHDAWKKHAHESEHGKPIPTEDCKNFVHITVVKYRVGGKYQYGYSVSGMLRVGEALSGAGLTDAGGQG
ncbi:hypothetical protein LMTR13_07840 [Bradyrhizobium icense]|uniref:Uncharacterized protein n=1 Tax=Bradyrhizobium icense TaxID=1274631 RepID=A0A1B1UBK5_9BRAD|nr:hypothetical protein LMTR13_07840 [Bradyrhizobium icense]